MDIAGKHILIVGGSGLVGVAVARELLPVVPARVVITGLTRPEAEGGAAELLADPRRDEVTAVEAAWGDVFLRDDLRERARTDVLNDDAAREQLLDDLYGELTDQVVTRSALGALLLRVQPQIIVDCINTATAFAYQNVFERTKRLRAHAAAGSVTREEIEQHLATMYLPQLIRHVQIALEA